MKEPKRYIIEDPRPIAKANPYTFYMPCEERRMAVAPGDSVKIIFASPEEDGMNERMWVKVTDIEGDTDLIGQLDNQPIGLPMSVGEEVCFSRHNIIDISTDRADDPEETCAQDDRVFHRCWVDARVWDDEEAPVKATNGHEQPEDYSHPMFPWGGWMIVGADWEEGMPLEIGTPAAILRREPAMGPHILGNDEDGNVCVEKIDGEWRSCAA